MKANELQIQKKQSAKRAGRGIAAGRGKTAGRGTKGQNSRAGAKRRPNFEGGQFPLFQRIPKQRGFKSWRQSATTITTAQLDTLGPKITAQTLVDVGLIDDMYESVKVVVKGEVTKKHNVELMAASAAAVAAIEKAGGSFQQVEKLKRPKKKSE